MQLDPLKSVNVIYDALAIMSHVTTNNVTYHDISYLTNL